MGESVIQVNKRRNETEADNNEGDLLFMFGGSDDGKQRIGLSTKIEAIQIGMDDKIYVLDSEKAQIQVFEPTEFTSYLHNALYLFSKGRYEESKEPLGKVLEMNKLFSNGFRIITS